MPSPCRHYSLYYWRGCEKTAPRGRAYLFVWRAGMVASDSQKGGSDYFPESGGVRQNFSGRCRRRLPHPPVLLTGMRETRLRRPVGIGLGTRPIGATSAVTMRRRLVQSGEISHRPGDCSTMPANSLRRASLKPAQRATINANCGSWKTSLTETAPDSAPPRP